MEVDVAQLGPQYATSSGPKSFHDVSALKGDDERTDHVSGCLFLWDDACRTRGNAATKAKIAAVEIFIQADERKIQPSWVRQWISLVYYAGPKETNEDGDDGDDDCCSMLSLSTDSAFDGPFPTERYALFLEYYSRIRLDSNDTDGSALRVLNVERKRVGIGWTLEYGDENGGEDSMARDVEMVEELNIEESGWKDEGRWGCGGNISGDTTANYSTKYDQANIEMDIEVNMGVASMPDISPLASLSNFSLVPSPDTSAARQLILEHTNSSQHEKEASPTHENYPTSFPPAPHLTSGSVENAHPDPSTKDEQPSFSTGPTGMSMSQTDAACMEESDATTEDANVPQHPIHPTSAPREIRGPCSIYDLAGILYPPECIETAHIREKLLHWKQLDLLQRGATRRPTRQEITKSERLKEGIARELGIVDAQLVQPSWASQWIQFILDAHDPHSRQLIVYNPSFSPSVSELVLLLRFFSLMMDDTQQSRDEALTILNCERKKRALRFTLELPKDMAKEFKNATAVVDYDMLIQIEQMPYPISEGTTDMWMDSYMDPGGREATICDDFRPKYKAPRPKNTPAGGRTIQTPQPPSSSWKRPEPLPIFEPVPLSSKPADLTSKYTDMLTAIGKPEPQTRHVWAKTRTDLCETAPYFRQAQAGVHVDKATRMIGYLLDGFPSPGDIWAKEGRLIVSHGGGGSHEIDKTTASARKKATTQERIIPSGSIALPRHVYDQSDATSSPQRKQSKPKVVLGADQSRGNRTISNLIKAKESGVPVVLIVGSNYRWWPLRMVKDGIPNHSLDGVDDEQGRGKYAVLGWYRVRDAWEELEPGNQSNDRIPLFVRCKFAFEWVEAQGTPWWLKDMEEAHSNWLSDVSIPKTIPDGAFSSCILEPGQGQQISAIDLWTSECCEDPPGLKGVSPSTYQCIKCLEISPIIYHDGWFCTNAKCSQFGLLLDDRFAPEITLSYSQDFIDRPVLPQPALRGLDGNDIKEFLASNIEGWPVGWPIIPRYHDGLKTYERIHWNGRCCLACGRLNSKIQWNVWTCATCSKPIEQESGDIYPLSEFLEPATKGRLNMPTLLPDCTDDPNTCVLYAHLEDGGDIYLVRTTTSEPFESMFGDFQRQALSRDMFRRSPLKSNLVSGMHTKHFQHNAGVPYNFSCQVTTESFEAGPPVVKQARDLLAEMASRVLNRDVEFNEVLSCAYKKEQSMNYHSDDDIGVQGTIAALSLGSPALMTFRPKQPRRKKSEGGEEETKEGEKKRSPVSPPPCLGFRMQHGDILIMDGIGIQQNYQHQVIPEGLRFAATARLIERPEGDDELDHRRRWKATKPGGKKKSDVISSNPPGLVSFPPSSIAETPAAAMELTPPAAAVSSTSATPANEEFIPSAFNTATIPSSATILTDSRVHTTDAPDSLLGAEASATFNSTTMTNSDVPLTNAPDFLFHTTATPMNED